MRFSRCLSSFTSLSNGKLELIGILLTFVWDFNSSTVLSFAEYLLIFGTESCPVVSELNQTLVIMYINSGEVCRIFYLKLSLYISLVDPCFSFMLSPVPSILHLRGTHNAFQLPVLFFFSFFCQHYLECRVILSKKLFYRPLNSQYNSVLCSYKKELIRFYSFSEQVAAKRDSPEATW